MNAGYLDDAIIKLTRGQGRLTLIARLWLETCYLGMSHIPEVGFGTPKREYCIDNSLITGYL
jgi:hypothetical protein